MLLFGFIWTSPTFCWPGSLMVGSAFAVFSGVWPRAVVMLAATAVPAPMNSLRELNFTLGIPSLVGDWMLMTAER